MYPLIEITTVPIEIQMKVTDAHLEYARGTAQMEISREQGGLNIRSHPIRVNIDTFEARSSVTPTTAQLIQQQAQNGVQGAYQATSVLAREGQYDDGSQNRSGISFLSLPGSRLRKDL